MKVKQSLFAVLAIALLLTYITASAQTSDNKIVFVGGGDIYSMNSNGSGPVNLTNSPLGGNSSPKWSPDGSKIGFIRNGQIWLMNANGANQHPIPGLAGISLDNFDWSPDGNKIAFHDWSDKYSIDIFTVRLDGSDLTQLTAGPGLDPNYFPDWSPDGSKIVFSTSAGIDIMNADGTGRMTVSNITGDRPTWSPDGSKIAFAAGEIFVVNADGSGLRALTNNAPFGCGCNTPTWSPDGTKIAFSTPCDGTPNIAVVNAQVIGDGGNYITWNSFPSHSPDWQRAAYTSTHQLLGRVTTAAGRGIAAVRVTLDDGVGNIRNVQTSSFGYFRFENVPTGKYTVSAKAKRYDFTPRSISVSKSIANLDFIAEN